MTSLRRTKNLGVSLCRLGPVLGFILLGTWSCRSEPRNYAPSPEDQGLGGGGESGGSGGSKAPGSETGGMGTSGQGGRESNVPSEPESCTRDADCLSGTCRISYRDADGDGYGADSETTGRCDGTIPEGYVSMGSDCCDDGGNLELAAVMNPGQTKYFAAPANICGIAWDYDCSGEVDFGGYTCSNSNSGEACDAPELRNYDSASATATSRNTGCRTTGLSCGEFTCSSEGAVVELAEADCGSFYALVGCNCQPGCGSPDACGCITVGGTTRRVVECR